MHIRNLTATYIQATFTRAQGVLKLHIHVWFILSPIALVQALSPPPPEKHKVTKK